MLLSELKYLTLKVVNIFTVFRSLILILRKFREMGLLFELSKPITWPKEIGFRYGIPLWTCGTNSLLPAYKYLTLKVVNIFTVFMSLILILRRFRKVGLLLHF